MVTCEVLQARPQAPQCALFVKVLLSQPSSGCDDGGCWQLPNPAVQVDVQSPFAQASTSTPALEQARPQAPQ